MLTNAKFTIDVENNKEAQLAGVIREITGIEMDEKILKYNGQQFSPEEIADKVMEMTYHG
ncbi:MAG: hypothetical protein GWP12_01730 [Nitrospirae bacterium]|nr:hypothetical protein [Nitrospirota bacterium]